MADRLIVRDWPRAMPVDLAAKYCGVGANTLTQHGPKPVQIGQKRKVWLRDQLDKWLDTLAGITPSGATDDEPNPWDNM
ncbi:MAG: hypothetical protein PHU07_13085 [Acidocella sp.]|nr:hypothetical protein [Acidocella sp.]